MARHFAATLPAMLRSVAGVLAVALAYGALALLCAGRLSAAMPQLALWLPAGLALAACLRLGPSCWPGLFLGSLAAHLTSDGSLLRAVPLSLGETLAPVAGAWAIRRSMCLSEVFHSVRNTSRLLGYGMLAGPALGTAAASFGGWTLDPQPLESPWSDWLTAWLRHAAGSLTLAPWLLALSELRRVPAVSLEYGAHWIVTAALSPFIFAGWMHAGISHTPVAFLMLPPLVWAGLRFATPGVTTTLLTLSSIAVLGAAYGAGPFDQPQADVSLLLLDFYLLVIGATLLIIHALATECRESGDRLMKNEIRLQAILDTAADGIVTIDERGRIELFNPAAAQMFGYATEEILGQNIDRLIPERDRDLHKLSLAAHVKSGHPHVLRRMREVRGLRKDGSSFPVEITIGEHRENGRRFTGILRDAGERRVAESALRESQQRLELSLAGGDLGTWDWRVQTGEAVFDERWARMLGFRVEEIAPHYQTWEQLLHPDDKPRVLPILNAHLAGETPLYEAEFRLRTRGGQWKWILARGKVFERDASGLPLRAVGIHSDISLRVHLEERLREQQAELLFVHRLTTAGELATTMAHELNQPLGAIASYLSGITRRFRPLLDQHPHLEQAVRETERLSQRAADVVSGVRNLVRKHETENESLAPDALINTTLGLAHGEILRRQVRVECRIGEALPLVRGQRILLQQLLVNLILNALEAMDSVDIARRLLIVQAAAADDQAVEMRVSNFGTGIPPAIAPRLFEPFVSSKPNGMGLGLSICRTIAERHGGSIRANSEPNGMTTFSVTLPAEG